MLRKIALVATSVFLTSTNTQSIQLQLSMMLGILFLSLVAQVSYRPHSNKSLYRLEVLSLCGSFLTVYCGTFFYGAGGASRFVAAGGFVLRTCSRRRTLCSQWAPFTLTLCACMTFESPCAAGTQIAPFLSAQQNHLNGCCFPSRPCPRPAADNPIIRITLSAVLISFNLLLVLFFVAMILREVIRSHLGLEKISRVEILRFLEERMWPSLGHREGSTWGHLLAVLLRWLIWRLEINLRGRKYKLSRTVERLAANLERATVERNVRERQRRAVKVVSWILHGAINTRELAERVARYEARPRCAADRHTQRFPPLHSSVLLLVSGLVSPLLEPSLSASPHLPPCPFSGAPPISDRDSPPHVRKQLSLPSDAVALQDPAGSGSSRGARRESALDAGVHPYLMQIVD